jgi:hypothetical protein
MEEVADPTPPSSPSTSVRRKAPPSNTSRQLFELTRPEFTPSEPPADIFHRPVRRVRVWEHHGERDDGAFAPNLYHVVAQLNDCESFRTRRRKPFAEFDDEMRTGDARLALVRRGVSLAKLISAKPRTYAPIETPRRFAAVNQILQKMPAQSSGIPPVRQIQFVRPVYAQPPDRVDFVSRISIAEPQRMRLRRIVQASEKQELRFQNEVIEALNHANQRRLRSSEAFFEDMSRYGLRRAQANAKRSTQRSRLRVRSDVDWWEEFIKFAFTGKVGREEEKFIERIARKPNLTFREYYEIVKELETRPEQNDRCLELLRWINARNNFADEDIIRILKEDEMRSKKQMSPRHRLRSFA